MPNTTRCPARASGVPRNLTELASVRARLDAHRRSLAPAAVAVRAARVVVVVGRLVARASGQAGDPDPEHEAEQRAEQQVARGLGRGRGVSRRRRLRDARRAAAQLGERGLGSDRPTQLGGCRRGAGAERRGRGRGRAHARELRPQRLEDRQCASALRVSCAAHVHAHVGVGELRRLRGGGPAGLNLDDLRVLLSAHADVLADVAWVHPEPAGGGPGYVIRAHEARIGGRDELAALVAGVEAVRHHLYLGLRLPEHERSRGHLALLLPVREGIRERDGNDGDYKDDQEPAQENHAATHLPADRISSLAIAEPRTYQKTTPVIPESMSPKNIIVKRNASSAKRSALAGSRLNLNTPRTADRVP